MYLDNDPVELFRGWYEEARQAVQALAKDRTLSSAVRAEQSEVAAWLSVWSQTPALFTDWLELRRRSPEFRKKFLT